MLIKVLGAAAGGGFPQWNCNCAGCRRSRSGDPAARPRTQASLAISADGLRWVLLNASPDLPKQIASIPALHPQETTSARHSPVSAVVISSGDVDCIAGLLSLREQQRLALYAHPPVLRIIEDNTVFRVLDPAFVWRAALPPHQKTRLADGQGDLLGLTVEPFAVSGKIPLYHEAGHDDHASDEAVIGLSVTDIRDRRLLFIPACAAMTDNLAARIEGADVLFFDGTLWQDDEMIRAGAGSKTGQRMGHMSVSGPRGSLAALASVTVKRRVFIHLNNTNPLLLDDSPEAAEAQQAGWEIAYDGMEITL
jgi:pyrroloquinoline quinone biosynthesis protein B